VRRTVLDAIGQRGDLDASRVVAYGGSWGGHWSARLAYTKKDRLIGAVVQGGPVHGYFQPEWQRKALGTREYLFGLFVARSAVYGVKTLEDFLAYGPRISLVTAGFINRTSAPMFIINGARDTQMSIDDLYVLLRGGTPKEVWLIRSAGTWAAPANSPTSRSSRR
jgi:esterase FrsA